MATSYEATPKPVRYSSNLECGPPNGVVTITTSQNCTPVLLHSTPEPSTLRSSGRFFLI